MAQLKPSFSSAISQGVGAAVVDVVCVDIVDTVDTAFGELIDAHNDEMFDETVCPTGIAQRSFEKAMQGAGH